MKILLTGASSYVGARLYLDISKKFDVIGTYHGTKLSEKFIPLDTTHPWEIKTCILKEKPDIIIHAAANANPRWCEANPEAAFQLNQQSTKSVVESANTINAQVFFISSFAAIHHTDIYGQTKLQSESYVRQTNAGFVILRPSLIIGFSPNTVNDRPFNRILKNLDEKTEAVYDTSWKFQPTYLGHLSEIITTLIENNISYETIPVVVPELKSRYDVAHDILEPFGIPVTGVDQKNTMPVTTDELETLKRLHLPTYSYTDIISKIVDEIHHRDRFVLAE